MNRATIRDLISEHLPHDFSMITMDDLEKFAMHVAIRQEKQCNAIMFEKLEKERVKHAHDIKLITGDW